MHAFPASIAIVITWDHLMLQSSYLMQGGLTVKGEICELMDTLLDLQQQFTQLPPPSGASYPVPTPEATLPQRAQSLLPLLLSSYGATLSTADQSLLRLLLHLNDIIYHSAEYQQQLVQTRDASIPGTDLQAAEDQEEQAGPVSARLHGPLAQCSFLWGAAAKAAHEKGFLRGAAAAEVMPSR